jgi:putative membrane protein
MNGGEGTGYGAAGGILMMVFWVAIIVGVVLLIVWLTRQVSGGTYTGGHGHEHYGPPRQDTGYTGSGETALDILKARYARGEIDKAEYEEKKKDLTA